MQLFFIEGADYPGLPVRICPGREFAESSLFIAIAMCLAVFNFIKAKDNDGRDIEPKVEYCAGTIRYIFFDESVVSCQIGSLIVIS